MTVTDVPGATTPRHGFRNFSWTQTATKEWHHVWAALWKVGVKWEWQNGDWYARKYGDVYNKFMVHNDATQLDMTIPLPSREIILEIHEYLLDLPTDDSRVDEATNLIRKWIKEYVG
jgi:hypothetical protein